MPDTNPRDDLEKLRKLLQEFSDTNPRDEPEKLWKLQQELLKIVEFTFGPCDPLWVIRQPRFCDKGPMTYLRGDTVWVKLSRNGECYWPTVVYEMAHETVHLLNPVPVDESNYLEEGVAVAFSFYVLSRCISDTCQKKEESRSPEKYKNALSRVKELQYEPLKTGKQIREQVGIRIHKQFGALSAATVQDLKALFQNVGPTDLERLIEKFPKNV